MPRFLRRWYVRWILLPLLVLAAAHAGWTLILASRFEARIEQLRAAGVPVELSDLAPPPVPDEDNAAPLLAEAEQWFEKHLAPNKPGVLMDEWMQAEWKPEDWARARAWLATGDPYVELLAQAAAKPALRQELDWEAGTDMEAPTLQQMQQATRFIENRVRYAERATPQALRELAIILDLAPKVERPIMVSMLVRWTMEYTAANALKDLARKPGVDAREARARLDDRFSAALDPELVPDALRGERVFALSLYRRWIAGESPRHLVRWVDEDHPWNFMDVLAGSWLGRPFAYRDALRGLDVLERALELARLPPREALSAGEALREEYRGSFPDFLSALFSTMPAKVFRERLRHLATVRIARVGLALLQLRQETGVWPPSLDAVVPLVGANTVIDPFTDKRLEYEPGVRIEAAVPIPSAHYADEEYRDRVEIVWRLE